MTLKILLVAAVGMVVIAGSALAVEAPRGRANLANVRWQDDPTEMWGVATVQAKQVSAANTNGGQPPVSADDHDRGRNPGPPPGPPPRRRTPPGPRSPHK